MSASAFSLTAMLPSSAVELTAGELVAGGLRTEDAQHQFCDQCKTWVLTRIPQFELVNLRATMLDDARWFVPYMETYASTRLSWATTPATACFDEFPADGDIPSLLAAYAAWASERGWPVASSAS